MRKNRPAAERLDPVTVVPLWWIARIGADGEDAGPWWSEGLGVLVVTPRSGTVGDADSRAYDVFQWLVYKILGTAIAVGVVHALIDGTVHLPGLEPALFGLEMFVGITAVLVAIVRLLVTWPRTTARLRDTRWPWLVVRAAIPAGAVFAIVAVITSA